MQTRTDFISKIQQICTIKICFNTEHKKYLVNDVWAEEINREYFNLQFYELEKLLYHNLRFINKKSEVLTELCELLWKKIERYDEHQIQKISFIDSIKSKILETSESLSSPKIDKYIPEVQKYFISIN